MVRRTAGSGGGGIDDGVDLNPETAQDQQPDAETVEVPRNGRPQSAAGPYDGFGNDTTTNVDIPDDAVQVQDVQPGDQAFATKTTQAPIYQTDPTQSRPSGLVDTRSITDVGDAIVPQPVEDAVGDFGEASRNIGGDAAAFATIPIKEGTGFAVEQLGGNEQVAEETFETVVRGGSESVAGLPADAASLGIETVEASGAIGSELATGDVQGAAETTGAVVRGAGTAVELGIEQAKRNPAETTGALAAGLGLSGGTALANRFSRVGSRDVPDGVSTSSSADLGTGGTGSLLRPDDVKQPDVPSGQRRQTSTQTTPPDSDTGSGSLGSFGEEFFRDESGRLEMASRQRRQQPDQPDGGSTATSDELLGGSPRDMISDDITSRALDRRQQASGTFDGGSDPLSGPRSFGTDDLGLPLQRFDVDTRASTTAQTQSAALGSGAIVSEPLRRREIAESTTFDVEDSVTGSAEDTSVTPTDATTPAFDNLREELFEFDGTGLFERDRTPTRTDQPTRTTPDTDIGGREDFAPRTRTPTRPDQDTDTMLTTATPDTMLPSSPTTGTPTTGSPGDPGRPTTGDPGDPSRPPRIPGFDLGEGDGEPFFGEFESDDEVFGSGIQDPADFFK